MVLIDGNVLRGYLAGVSPPHLTIRDESGNVFYVMMTKKHLLNLSSINFSKLVEPQDFVLSDDALMNLVIKKGKNVNRVIEKEVSNAKINDDILKSYEKARSIFNKYISNTLKISANDENIDESMKKCEGFGNVYAVGIRLGFKISRMLIDWLNANPKSGNYTPQNGNSPPRFEINFTLDFKPKVTMLPFCIDAKTVATLYFFKELIKMDPKYYKCLRSVSILKKKF